MDFIGAEILSNKDVKNKSCYEIQGNGYLLSLTKENFHQIKREWALFGFKKDFSFLLNILQRRNHNTNRRIMNL